jgi:hypothetical protein
VRRPLAVLALVVAIVAACGGRGDDASPADVVTPALDRLRRVETSRRAATDFRSEGAADDALGADPSAVTRIPGSALAVGALRGASAVVLLDADGREVDRARAPRGASTIAVGDGGEVFVAGDLAGEVARSDVRTARLVRTGSISLDGVSAARAIAYGPERVLHLVEEHDHRLLTVDLDAGGTIVDAAEPPIGLGPIAVVRTRRWVVVDCLLSHEVVAMPVDAGGRPRRSEAVRIRHDGPVWAIDAVETGDALWLAMGGVEDHPLDRRQGSFGYIDSFAWVYRVAPPLASRLAAVNVGSYGVVTPKLVGLDVEPASVILHIVGYATPLALDLRWAEPRPNRKGVWPPPDVTTRPLVPGVVGATAPADGRRILADPLLDAWVVDDGRSARLVPVATATPHGSARRSSSRR